MLLLGAFDQSLHAHNAHRRRALERHGCRVTVLDRLQRPGLIERLTGHDYPRRIRRALDEHAPDLVLVVGDESLEPDLLGDLRCHRRAVWAQWLVADPRDFDMTARALAPYDHVFAPGADGAARLGERLGREVHVLPLAADPSVYRPVRSRDQYRANVVFAGRATPHREALLTQLVEFGLALWGPGWRSGPLKDYCRGEHLETDEFIRAYGGASVGINIHDPAPDTGRSSCNQRLFELAAMGVPQVVDARGDLEAHFTADGTHVVAVDDAEGLRAEVQALLEDPPEALSMAGRGRAHALAHHTYMHRIAVLLERVGRTK